MHFSFRTKALALLPLAAFAQASPVCADCGWLAPEHDAAA